MALPSSLYPLFFLSEKQCTRKTIESVQRGVVNPSKRVGPVAEFPGTRALMPENCIYLYIYHPLDSLMLQKCKMREEVSFYQHKEIL